MSKETKYRDNEQTISRKTAIYACMVLNEFHIYLVNIYIYTPYKILVPRREYDVAEVSQADLTRYFQTCLNV